MNPTISAVPHGVFLTRLLFLCFFSVFSVTTANVLMLGIPEASEALQAFDGWHDRRYAFFLAGFVCWAVSSWYTSRLLIGKRFKNDALGTCASAPFAYHVTRWLPRLLGLMAVLPSMAYFALHGQHVEAAGIALVGAVFLAFVVFRRRWFLATKDARPEALRWFDIPHDDGLPGEQWEHFNALTKFAKVTLWLLGLAPYTLLGLTLADDPNMVRYVGAPALLLLAFTGWTVFGAMVLVYWPKSHGWSALTWVPFATYALFSLWNENHLVGQSTAELRPLVRPDLVTDFQAWYTAREQAGLQDQPIYFVAANGGASRSGFWASYFLARLEDRARAANKPFAQNIYAISGISGGSVGSAAFVAALATRHWVTQQAGTPPPSGQPAAMDIAPLIHAFFAQDDLTPVMGGLLYGDLLARFWPWAIPAFDRSRRLENAWQQDWKRLSTEWLRSSGIAQGPATESPERLHWFDRPLEAMYQDPWRNDASPSPTASAVLLPRLFLNTASMQLGTPVLQAPVTLPASVPADDLFDQTRFDSAQITLAQAAHNSARFPLISPVGLVFDKKHQRWGHLGDGGYFESSGAWTLTQILDTLQEKLPADVWAKVQPHVRIVLLDGNPNAPDSPSWLLDDKGSATCSGANAPRACTSASMPSTLLIELTGPVQGLFAARSGRAVSESRALWLAHGQATCPSKQQRIFEIRQPKLTTEDPPMSWILNQDSMGLMRSIMDGTSLREITQKSSTRLGGVAPAAEEAWTRFDRQRQQLLEAAGLADTAPAPTASATTERCKR